MAEKKAAVQAEKPVEDVGTEVTIRLPYQKKGNDHAADLTCG